MLPVLVQPLAAWNVVKASNLPPAASRVDPGVQAPVFAGSAYPVTMWVDVGKVSASLAIFVCISA